MGTKIALDAIGSPLQIVGVLLNSDPDAVRMYYERRRQNTGPPPFGRGRVNSNTAGAASGPRSRPIPRGFEQWRSSINMPVNRYSQGPSGMGGGDGQYEDPRVSYLPTDRGIPTFDMTGMDERFSQMMDFQLRQFDMMMQHVQEQSHTGRSQARQARLSEASAPRTSNMFQAKVEREEYETEVKIQNDPENPMSFSSLKNRAKLSTPPIFNGTYSEEYNILNWIIAVERYLLQCEISTRAYSSFAYTYLGTTCQAWFDTKFVGDPTPAWPDATTALTGRYLPIDHVARLVRKFAGIKQQRTLMDYMEKFQILISALQLASVEKSMVELVRQFIDGLKNYDDRIQMLTRRCDTLDDCYELATLIRGAKSTNDESPSNEFRSKNNRDQKKFHRLEGASKKKAQADGACLECGKSDHWWRNCPKLKPKAYRYEKGRPDLSKKKKAFLLESSAPSSEPAAETSEEPADNLDPESSGTESIPNDSSESSKGDDSD